MSDPAAYDEFIHALAELESPDFLEGMAMELEDTVKKLIEQGFDTATDPYGNVWAPRKLAAGRTEPPHLPLRKSYNMHDSFHVESNASGVKVTNPVVYAPVQNYGNLAGTLAARGMLPHEGELGNWEEPLRKTAREYFFSKISEDL